MLRPFARGLSFSSLDWSTPGKQFTDILKDERDGIPATKSEIGRILPSLLRKHPTFRDHWFPPETSGGRRGMSAVFQANFYGTRLVSCKFRGRFFFCPLISRL